MKILSLFLVLIFSSLCFADTPQPLISTSFEDGLAGLAGLGVDTLEWNVDIVSGAGATCYIADTAFTGSKSLAFTADSGVTIIKLYVEIFLPDSKWTHIRYMAYYPRETTSFYAHTAGVIHYWDAVKSNPITLGRVISRPGISRTTVYDGDCDLGIDRTLSYDSLIVYFTARDDTSGSAGIAQPCGGIVARNMWHRYDIIIKNDTNGYIKTYLDGHKVGDVPALLDTANANYVYLGLVNSQNILSSEYNFNSYFYDDFLIDTTYSIPCKAAELGLDSLPMRR